MQFKEIYGWKTPDDQSVEVTEMGTIVSGIYDFLPLGSVSVTIEPESVINEGAQWRVDRGPDTSWHESGDTISDIAVGTYKVQFKDVYGWEIPANQIIEITEDRLTEISSIYKFQGLFDDWNDFRAGDRRCAV